MLPNWESPYWSKAIATQSVPADSTQSGEMSEILAAPLDWEGAVSFLPRAYLGCAIHFDAWFVENDTHTRYLEALLQAQRQIAEVRSLDGATHSILYRDTDGHLAPHVQNDLVTEGVGQCWLVIYPAPDGTGLCPMLYWCQGEGGVHVCVLNDESIDILSAFHVCNTAALSVESLFDRIHRLAIGDSYQLEVEWMRTAFDLLDNPFLRASLASQSFLNVQSID